MRIRLAHPTLVDALIETLRAASCRVDRLPDDELEISHTEASSEAEERMELVFFLRAWERHAGVRATILP